MGKLTVNNVRIAGLAACVPARVEENLSLPLFKDEAEARKVIASTGIERRRVVHPGTTASDLTLPAVEKLLAALGWQAEEVDCLIYVCTSRDFIAPQTACILQHRLGLREDCYVMDLPLGCSGWVYGMSVIGALMQSGTFRRGLLVAAETNTTNRSAKDRTVKPLFGDAATVTALVHDPTARPFNFVFGVDGSGYQAVWTKYGGSRFPTTPEALEERETEPGVVRRGTDMEVKGMDVFAFAIKRPGRSLAELIDTFSIDLQTVDFLLLHQANRFIDEKIRKSLKLPPEKVPYALNDFGNVTSASIPLTMVTRLSRPLAAGSHHLLACGFGVGLAWASMEFWIDDATVAELVEMED